MPGHSAFRALRRGHSAFRALRRGYVHWASGRLTQNCQHPSFCHVRCNMTPSMKPGVCHVYILLGKGELATIEKATCECAAGDTLFPHFSANLTVIILFTGSQRHVQVSGLLHALVSITKVPFEATVLSDPDEAPPLPITSYACRWKAPRKRNVMQGQLIQKLKNMFVFMLGSFN